jgi:hypothetical protein
MVSHGVFLILTSESEFQVSSLVVLPAVKVLYFHTLYCYCHLRRPSVVAQIDTKPCDRQLSLYNVDVTVPVPVEALSIIYLYIHILIVIILETSKSTDWLYL